MIKKVISNYLYTLGYQVFLMILPVITLPYISRVLLPHGVGVNSWAYSFSSYFLLFAVLGLTTYGQREIAICKDSEMRSRVFWEIEFSSIITTLVALGAYLISILFINKYQVYLLIYSISIFASLFDISWLFSGTERFSVLTLRNLIIKIISVISMFVFVHNPNDLAIYIFIQAITVLISNISLWPVAIKMVGFPKEFLIASLVNRIKHSFTFFIPQISISLYVTLNKVILGFISGAVQTGYFDSSDRIVRLIFSVFIAISTVMLPRMSSFYSLKEYDKISSFTHVILVLSIWLVLPLIFGIIANTSMIVLVLLGQAYAPMKIVLKLSALILLPMSIANVLGNQILIPMNRVGKYTISVISGAVINLLIDFPLIISWGAQGAAIASIISETVVAACQIIFCLDMLKKFEFSWEIIKAFVVAVILFPSTILLMTLFKSTVILTLVFSIVVAGIYMLLTARIPVKLIQILKKMT